MNISRFLVFLIAVSIYAFAPTVSAQPGTAFSYQGELRHEGGPANGLYDFEFLLFSAAQAGVPLAGPVESPGVTVIDGIFTTVIDFGAGAFSADQLWLEIHVRSAGGGGFTTLLPRQQILPAPMALYSQAVSGSAMQSISTIALYVSGAFRQGGGTSITVPADGLPIIAFNGLRIAKCNDPYCLGGDETITEISSGIRPTLALAGDGLPVVAFQHATNRRLFVAHCNDPACTGGDETVTEVISQAVSPPSMAIGADGFPVITFISGEEIWVVRCNDVACSGNDESVNSQVTAATAVVNSGDQVAIGIGSGNDLPILLYRQDQDEDAYLIICNDPACQGQDETESRLEPGIPSGPSGDRQFVFGPDGNPIIFSPAVGTRLCSDPLCSGPRFITQGGSVHEDASATTGPDGIPAHASTDGLAVVFGRCRNVACDEPYYGVPVVSGVNDIKGTSMAFSRDGNPMISYLEHTSAGHVLRLFRCMSPTCQ